MLMLAGKIQNLPCWMSDVLAMLAVALSNTVCLQLHDQLYPRERN